MSKSKIRVGNTTTNNTSECAETSVYLVDNDGKHIGVANLKTKPGVGLHMKFENAMKLIVK